MQRSPISNMSSSEGENFDLDVSDSEEEDYIPVKKVRVLSAQATAALANVELEDYHEEGCFKSCTSKAQGSDNEI